MMQEQRQVLSKDDVADVIRVATLIKLPLQKYKLISQILFPRREYTTELPRNLSVVNCFAATPQDNRPQERTYILQSRCVCVCVCVCVCN